MKRSNPDYFVVNDQYLESLSRGTQLGMNAQRLNEISSLLWVRNCEENSSSVPNMHSG